MKKVCKKFITAVVTTMLNFKFFVQCAFAAITEESITGAASESIDSLCLVLGAAFILAGVGSGIFAGYNLYLTFNEGGSGNSSQKAAGGFAACGVALTVGIIILTIVKGTVKKGLGLGA